MHALAGYGVQIRGQCCHERLALAGAHLADSALMKHYAADYLHRKMPHSQHAVACLAANGERFGKHAVQTFARGISFFKIVY